MLTMTAKPMPASEVRLDFQKSAIFDVLDEMSLDETALDVSSGNDDFNAPAGSPKTAKVLSSSLQILGSVHHVPIKSGPRLVQLLDPRQILQ
jgi:hypothetical protein